MGLILYITEIGDSVKYVRKLLCDVMRIRLTFRFCYVLVKHSVLPAVEGVGVVAPVATLLDIATYRTIEFKV